MRDDNSLQQDRDIKYLMDIPPALSSDTHTEELNVIFRFITGIVIKMLGKRSVKKWVKDNKGKSPLDMITMSDIAYCLTLIENNKEKWDQAHDIMQLPPEEQEKWKNPKKLPEDEREQYIKKMPRFTSRKGNKASYKKSGMNAEGEAFYNNKWEAWKKLARDKRSWDLLQEGWDEYNSNTGWSEQWVDHELATVSNEEEDREGESMEVSADAFALPGDEGFTQDRAGEFRPGGEQNNLVGHKRTRDDTLGSSGTSSDESDSDSEKEEDEEEMPPLIQKKGRRTHNLASV